MATVDTLTARQANRPRNWTRTVRRLHLYLGTFFAPAILFFAVSGGLQTYSWHEHRPSDPTYQAPVWLQKMAQLHKKQTLELPARHGPENGPRSGAKARPPEQPAKPMPMGTQLQKAFVASMSIGLVFTTLLGLYMSFKFNPGKASIWLTLAAGAALPIVFALL